MRRLGLASLYLLILFGLWAISPLRHDARARPAHAVRHTADKADRTDTMQSDTRTPQLPGVVAQTATGGPGLLSLIEIGPPEEDNGSAIDAGVKAAPVDARAAHRDAAPARPGEGDGQPTFEVGEGTFTDLDDDDDRDDEDD